MDESAIGHAEPKVYRYNRTWQLYHFGIGTLALILAAVLYRAWLLSAVVALFAVFMIARPLIARVILDIDEIIVKGMFGENSLQRSCITSYERVHTGKANYVVLRGGGEDEVLEIPDMFRFDGAWDDWLKTLRDVSDDKPLSIV
jgi:hypothetical protein